MIYSCNLSVQIIDPHFLVRFEDIGEIWWLCFEIFLWAQDYNKALKLNLSYFIFQTRIVGALHVPTTLWSIDFVFSAVGKIP